MTIRRSSFQAIGTKWDLQVQDDIGDEPWQDLLGSIHVRIEAFDTAYSRFRPDSLVTQISYQAGRYTLPDDGFQLLEMYKQLYDATDGKVTPLIGQTMADAGYDAEYSLRSKQLQPPPSWQDVLSYDETSLTVSQPVLLDFGAAGKGYLVDIVGQIVEGAGLKNFTINASGDIMHRSTVAEELKIGLENPLDTSEAIGIVQLANRSLCASAGSKRKWGAFNHIINPKALKSPDEILATWVIANDTMTADSVSTALFFTKPAVLQKKFKFSYAVLAKDMSLQYAKDFPVTVFKA